MKSFDRAIGQSFFFPIETRIFFSCFRRNSESEVAAAAKGGSRKTSLSRDSSKVFFCYCFQSPIHITAASASDFSGSLVPFTYLLLLFQNRPEVRKR